MPFLPPNQQRQSTEGKKNKQKRSSQYSVPLSVTEYQANQIKYDFNNG